MSALSVPSLTPERYLEIERASDIRHEYYQGYMWAMSGGSLPHAVISANLLAELHQQSRSNDCKVVGSDLRLRVDVNGLYTYPDIIGYCGGAEIADKHDDTILNPTVLVEVLSKSTEAYDRGFKSTQYRTIDSLKEYALVSQREPRIEIYRRHGSEEWRFTEVTGLHAFCEFPSIQSRIPLVDIYDGIEFEKFDPRPGAE